MRNRSWRRGVAAFALSLLTVTGVPAAAMAAPPPAYPFRDPRLPLERRVEDLVGRLTLDEKVSLLHQYQPAIPRLGIKLFKAGTEALHGVAWSNDVDDNGNVVTAEGTVFPQAVGLASTWDPELIRRVGSAVGDEARGYHKLDDRVWGLNLWAPVVNLLRDPRWGRNEEGYSEDPLLTGAISTAYGKGLEGDDPRYLKAAPTLKHYLAYNNEAGRDVTSSDVGPRVLNEYDREAFRPALQAGAATGVMASYNLVNGRPATVDPELGTLVRSWSDKPLFNVSDAYAPYNLTGSQKYYATQPEADAAVIRAGLDSFTVDNTDGGPTIAAVTAALAQGILTVRDVDRAAGHALSLRFRLGEFDPDGGPYAAISPDVIDSPAHRQLARQTAADATVLLKNDRRALPLKKDKVAVVGPLSDTLYSDWYGGRLPYGITAADGIRERATSVTTSDGADRIALRDVATGRYVTATGTTDATPVTATGTTASAAAQFDMVGWGQGVVTLKNVGNGRYLGWGNTMITRNEQPNGWYVQQQFRLETRSDGTSVLRYAGYETAESWFSAGTYVTVGADGNLTLTADAAKATRFAKETLVSGIDQAVAAAQAADTAVVVVGSMPFINGREAHDRTTTALAESQEALLKAVLKANPNTVAVLQTSYPDTITWAQQHVPAIVWTTHAGAETGHALADVLYGAVNPAGRLTQTWYRSDAQLPADLNQYDIITTGQTYLYSRDTALYAFGHGLSYTSFRYANLRVRGTTITADVTNTGSRSGDEVVQLYAHQKTSRDPLPVKQLRAFERISLRPGQTRTVTFRLNREDLRHWDVTRSRWVVEDATHDILVGSSSSDIRLRGTLKTAGERIPARDLTHATRAETFDTYAGTRLVDESKKSGTAVSGPGRIGFKDAIVGRTFTASVALAGSGSSTIEVRQGSPAGRLLATASAPATGSVYSYRRVRADLPRVSGRGDIYLVLGDGVRISEFRVS
jgi:beta-glucosidase